MRKSYIRLTYDNFQNFLIERNRNLIRKKKFELRNNGLYRAIGGILASFRLQPREGRIIDIRIFRILLLLQRIKTYRAMNNKSDIII